MSVQTEVRDAAPPLRLTAARPRRVASLATLSEARAWAWPAVVAALTTGVSTLFSAWQWSHYVVKSWDLGIFTQMFQQYAALHAPIVSIKGVGFNLLGDHFHPLLALLTPIYALFPHAFTLLVIQDVCFGIAAAVLTRTARRFLGPAKGTLFGLAFAFSFGLEFAVDAQFHEVALAVPLLTASVAALLEERWRRAALWALPLVFVKEDLGVTVAVLGVIMAFRARDHRLLWVSVWGLGWSALAIFVILPALNPGGSYAYTDALDPAGSFTDPLAYALKALTVVLLLGTTAGIAVRSPLALALLPTLAWRFLSNDMNYWGPQWHYGAELMPLAFAATLDGIRLAGRSPRAWLRGYGRHAAVVAIAVAAVLQFGLPFHVLASRRALEPAPRATQAATVLAAVPPGATVESDIGLMSYLVGSHRVYWVGNSNPAPDCILLDREDGSDAPRWGNVLSVAAALHPGYRYALRYQAAGYELACRPAEATSLAVAG